MATIQNLARLRQRGQGYLVGLKRRRNEMVNHYQSGCTGSVAGVSDRDQCAGKRTGPSHDGDGGSWRGVILYAKGSFLRGRRRRHLRSRIYWPRTFSKPPRSQIRGLIWQYDFWISRPRVPTLIIAQLLTF